MAELTDKKNVKMEKAKKVADPVAATTDVASQQMIRRAQQLGIETVFDRAVTMKPCNIGIQGTPAIVVDSGEMIPGYVAPKELSEYLDAG